MGTVTVPQSPSSEECCSLSLLWPEKIRASLRRRTSSARMQPATAARICAFRLASARAASQPAQHPAAKKRKAPTGTSISRMQRATPAANQRSEAVSMKNLSSPVRPHQKPAGQVQGKGTWGRTKGLMAVKPQGACAPVAFPRRRAPFPDSIGTPCPLVSQEAGTAASLALNLRPQTAFLARAFFSLLAESDRLNSTRIRRTECCTIMPGARNLRETVLQHTAPARPSTGPAARRAAYPCGP